jgi:hypothetical protein
MMLDCFVDELMKLGAEGALPLSALAIRPTRNPRNAIGALVRQALRKRASDLAALHAEVAPPALDVRPADASTRSPDGGVARSTIVPGALGPVTSSPNPIDLERFNRVWGQPLR